MEALISMESTANNLLILSPASFQMPFTPQITLKQNETQKCVRCPPLSTLHSKNVCWRQCHHRSSWESMTVLNEGDTHLWKWSLSSPFQGTASYNHPISFLLAALKQYFPLFSLDESDTILWFFLLSLTILNRRGHIFVTSHRRLSIISINLDTSPWTFWRTLETINMLSAVTIMSAKLGRFYSLPDSGYSHCGSSFRKP